MDQFHFAFYKLSSPDKWLTKIFELQHWQFSPKNHSPFIIKWAHISIMKNPVNNSALDWVFMSIAETTIPYAPSPMYCRLRYLGPTLKTWPLINWLGAPVGGGGVGCPNIGAGGSAAAMAKFFISYSIMIKSNTLSLKTHEMLFITLINKCCPTKKFNSSK